MKDKITLRIEKSDSLRESIDGFLSELGSWIEQCKAELPDILPNDNHDQGTFSIGWRPCIIERQDKDSLSFLKKLRDDIKKHHEQNGLWKNGYWKVQEAHHGTEHFELFLVNLYRIDPGDGKTISQMKEAAEHFGNWSGNAPDCFSWEKNLFYSFHFGTETEEQKRENIEINKPEHFRYINICIYAYKMTGNKKYLSLADSYAEGWVDAITTHPSLLPTGLSEKGPVYDMKERTGFDDYILKYPELKVMDNVDRAENFLASDVPNTLLTLWKITGKSKFRAAADVLTDIISTQVRDYDAGCGVDLLRKYRNRTGNLKYDELILNAVREGTPYSFDTITIAHRAERQTCDSKISGHTVGIGKRKDKPVWYEDGKAAAHNPILLALAAEITYDSKLACRSLDIARTYFKLARTAYPHGHEHGCSSRSVSAIARGNGRENNSGVVTAVLEPLIAKFNPNIS